MCNHAPIGEPLGTFWGSVSCPRILQESNYQHPEWRTTARPHELQKNDHRLIIWHLVAPCWFTFAIRELTLPVCTDITEAAGLKFNLGHHILWKVRNATLKYVKIQICRAQSNNHNVTLASINKIVLIVSYVWGAMQPEHLPLVPFNKHDDTVLLGMNTQNLGVSGRGEGRIGIVKSTQILPLENTSVSLQPHQALFSKGMVSILDGRRKNVGRSL